MRIIRASEIGSFLYCERAWWYQLQGLELENRVELENGNVYHRRHGRQVLLAVLLRLAGWVLLLAALILTAIAITGAFLQ
jgi:hypothetical protein